jgi:hypothetical protein
VGDTVEIDDGFGGNTEIEAESMDDARRKARIWLAEQSIQIKEDAIVQLLLYDGDEIIDCEAID